MASWGTDKARVYVVLNDNTHTRRRRIAVGVIIAVVLFAATFIGGRHVAHAEGYSQDYVEQRGSTATRCAVVDVHANKVVMVKQGAGDTIIRVVAYVDNGDNIEWEGHVWRFARRLVTQGIGTGLRRACR